MAAIPHLAGKALAGTVGASVTTYVHIGAGAQGLIDNTEANKKVRWRSAGLFSNLMINLVTNSRGASTFKLRKNGANGNGAISIPSSTAGHFEDVTNTDTVAAGDDICAQIVTGAGGAAFTWTVHGAVFSATSNTVCRYVSLNGLITGTAFLGFANTNDTTDTNQPRSKFKTAGTLKNAAVFVVTNGRNGNCTCAVAKAGTDTTITITVPTTTAGLFEDTTHTEAVAVDDAFDWHYTFGGSSGTQSIGTLAVDFETTSNAAQFVSNSANITISAGVTTFFSLNGPLSANATESNVSAHALLAGGLSNLAVRISSNSIAASSSAAVRQGGSDSALSVTIPSSTSGTFENTGTTLTLAASDVMAFRFVMGGAAGTAVLQYMGVVWNGVASSVGGLVNSDPNLLSGLIGGKVASC
jgi:hypothetical protein